MFFRTNDLRALARPPGFSATSVVEFETVMASEFNQLSQLCSHEGLQRYLNPAEKN
jgi:hypothetical protein